VVPRHPRRTRQVDEAILGAYMAGAKTRRIREALEALIGSEGEDASIPPAHVDAITDALEREQRRREVVVSPNADHAFFCDQRATYERASADDAWRRPKDPFSEELR
jgi:carboxymethylenebutenolidase